MNVTIIANKICDVLNHLMPLNSSNISNYNELIQYVGDRPGHYKRYAMDASIIENELGWKAEENFESGIIKTVEWYLRYGK